MKESVFQSEIIKSIRNQGGWCAKFPDMPNFGTIIDCPKCRTKIQYSGSRFIPKKPFDLVGIHDGVPFAIECKMSIGYKAFNQNVMRRTKEKDLPREEWNQIKSLIEFERCGGSSFVFLNVRSVDTGNRFSRLIIFPILILLQQWDRFDGSIKKADLSDTEYIGGHKKEFDMSKFFNARIR